MEHTTRRSELTWLAAAAALFAVVTALAGPLDMAPRDGDAAACVNPATATARSAPGSQ